MPIGYAGITLVAEQSQVAHKYMHGYVQDHTGDPALHLYLTFQVMIFVSELNAQGHYTFLGCLALWGKACKKGYYSGKQTLSLEANERHKGKYLRERSCCARSLSQVTVTS